MGLDSHKISLSILMGLWGGRSYRRRDLCGSNGPTVFCHFFLLIMGGGASVRAYSEDLKDTEVIKLLAICAQDVYKLDGVLLENKLQLEKSVQENQSTDTNLQYAVYKILQGTHTGQTILRYSRIILHLLFSFSCSFCL
jgi:hypothetical protein